MPSEPPPLRSSSMRRFFEHVSQDWSANSGLPKSLIVLTFFRTASWCSDRRRGPGIVAYALVAVLYKVVSEWILGIEIPVRTRIGAGLRLRHGVGVVLNPASVLGRDVLLRQGVTIGNRSGRTRHECPVIGDGVEFGAYAIVVGPVVVGDRAVIGAGALVAVDVPSGAMARATPAEIRIRESTPETEPEQRDENP